MADTIGTAYIQIEPSTKGISGAISGALDKEASSAGASAGGKLSSALGGALKAGVAAIGAATGAMAAFGAAAVKSGAEFDTSMSQVAATMGMSVADLNDSSSQAAQDFQKLRDFAQEMGATTAFSAKESADALNYMALAGYDVETSIRMLPNVLNLAAAGAMDLATASDMVTDAQTALGLSLDETDAMVDQMAVTASKSNTSVQQLGEAFLKIGANARNVKGGTQELSTVLGVLADNGIKGTEAGTHLRNIMLALTPKSEAAAKAMEELGMQAYDAEGNLRSLPDIFNDMSKAMEGMTQEQKTTTLAMIFNKTDLASINALLGTSAERYEELSTAIGDCAGAAGEMANVQLDNLQGDITLFKSALEGVKIAISDGITPTIRDFVQFGTDGISTLTESIREKGLMGAMEDAGKIVGELAVKIADQAPKMVDSAIKLLEAMGKAFMDNLDKLIDSAVKITESIAKGILDNLPTVIDAALRIIEGLGRGLIEALPTIGPQVVEVVTKICQTITEHLNDIIEIALQIILALADGLSKALPDLIPTIVDTVIFITETLIDHVDELLEASLKIIMALGEGIVKSLPKLAEKLPQIITQVITTLTEHLPEIIKMGGELTVQIAVGLIKALPELIRAIPDIVMALIEGFVSFYENFKEVGADIVDGIWEGIKATWRDLIDSVCDMAGELVSRVQSFFDIGSPSKLMRDQIGKWIPEGIAVGIEASSDSVYDAMDDLSANTVLKADSFATDVTGAGVTVADGNENKINAMYQLLQTYLPNVATNDKLNNLNFNVNNREFARLVNEVG